MRERKKRLLACISPDEVLETATHVRTLQQSSCDSTAGREGLRENGFVAQAMLSAVELLVSMLILILINNYPQSFL